MQMFCVDQTILLWLKYVVWAFYEAVINNRLNDILVITFRLNFINITRGMTANQRTSWVLAWVVIETSSTVWSLELVLSLRHKLQRINSPWMKVNHHKFIYIYFVLSVMYLCSCFSPIYMYFFHRVEVVIWWSKLVLFSYVETIPY